MTTLLWIVLYIGLLILAYRLDRDRLLIKLNSKGRFNHGYPKR